MFAKKGIVMPAVAVPTEVDELVGMGQIALLPAPKLGRAVLGSCVGIALYDERKRLGALAHVVLPKASGREVPAPGKFADTAIEWMLDALARQGADRKRLLAKLAGGANMFAAAGPFQIGKQNADAVRGKLGENGIRLVAEHLGGTQGRRVTFDVAACSLMIEVVGQRPLLL